MQSTILFHLLRITILMIFWNTHLHQTNQGIITINLPLIDSTYMSIAETTIQLLNNVLQLQDKNYSLDHNSPLLGAIPEFDSMAVVSVITALEDHFGFTIDDDEIDGELFESFGSLVAFATAKVSG